MNNQRQTKFRVWDINKKEFLKYPCYFNHLDFNEFTCFDRYFKCDEDECIPQQFTGLQDINKKDIYEGDILKHPNYHNGDLKGEYIDVIEWGETGDSDGWSHNKHFEYVIGRNSAADVYEKSEIIGNIFENPELLEK